jgi:hypothetical protein
MRNFLVATLAALALFGAGMGGTMGQSSGKPAKAKAAKSKEAKGDEAKGNETKGNERNRWMVVHNKTEKIARSIFIIPSGEDCCWSRNLLDEDEFIAGESKLTVKFDDGSSECKFDIHVLGTDRTQWTFTKRDVCAKEEHTGRKANDACDGQTICLEKSASTNVKREATVRNASDLTAFSVYAIPSGKECCWSSDLFGPRFLDKKDDKGKPRELDIDLDDKGRQPGSECTFDIRVISNLRADWRFYGIEVCGTKPTITLKDLPLSKDVKDEKDEAKREANKKKRLLTVKNESKLTARYAFAIPSNRECCWSVDLFGPNILLPGKGHEINLDDGNGSCTFDIRFLTHDIPGEDGGPIRAGEEWNFDRLNVCTMKERVITLKGGR